jgi:hypothetical protein
VRVEHRLDVAQGGVIGGACDAIGLRRDAAGLGAGLRYGEAVASGGRPEATGATNRLSCRSLPNCNIPLLYRELLSDMIVAWAASAYAISSSMSTKLIESRPAPPYSSGPSRGHGRYLALRKFARRALDHQVAF